jgi:hypothetical protein
MTSRDLRLLPKTHLHLHFSGSMRHLTLVELADKHGVRLPDALRTDWPPQLSAADERGWFRFQRLYDIARSVLRTEDDVRRLVREAAEDDRADGSRWLEIQVDPSGYASRFHGITEFTDLVLDAALPSTHARSRGWQRSTSDVVSSGSGCPMTSGVGPRRSSRRHSGSPATPGCSQHRTVVSSADQRPCEPVSTSSGPGGSGMACALSRTRTC